MENCSIFGTIIILDRRKILRNVRMVFERILKLFCHFLNLNLNSLLVKRQIDNPSPGTVTGGNLSLALTREVNCLVRDF